MTNGLVELLSGNRQTRVGQRLKDDEHSCHGMVFWARIPANGNCGVARSLTQEVFESPNTGLHHFLNFDEKARVSFPANLSHVVQKLKSLDKESIGQYQLHKCQTSY